MIDMPYKNPNLKSLCARRLGMIRRCTDPTHPSYPRYGGRGITICRRWLNSFDDYVEDVGFPPSLDMYLDRIDNDGNYEPSNVRWVTSKESASNRCLRPYKNKAEDYVKLTPAGKFAVRMRLRPGEKPGARYYKTFNTFDEALEHSQELLYEREMHRQLGLN